MTEISGRRSLRFISFFLSISLQFIIGFSNDSPSSKNSTKAESHTASRSGIGSTVVIIFLVLVVVVLSFFLFKLWQKKKREDQYARLLKLFEDDDELELELGLRD